MIVVTGSNGCVGSALKELCATQSDWVFLTRKDCDLTNREKTIELFGDLKPDALVHLASYVPGFYNINRTDSFTDNVRINENVLEAANTAGINKGLFCLSVNMFPEHPSKLPVDESMMMEGTIGGPFAGYGYSKRMLAMQCQNYNLQYNRNYFGIIPCNIYGPNDNLSSGRLIPNLIHKFKEAIKTNSDVTINGTGKPIRQFIYSYDLAKIIKHLILNYNDNKSIICCGNEQISIYDLVLLISKIVNFQNKIIFDTSKQDGYLKKDVSNKLLLETMDFSFTPLEIGLKETINNMELI